MLSWCARWRHVTLRRLRSLCKWRRIIIVRDNCLTKWNSKSFFNCSKFIPQFTIISCEIHYTIFQCHIMITSFFSRSSSSFIIFSSFLPISIIFFALWNELALFSTRNISAHASFIIIRYVTLFSCSRCYDTCWNRRGVWRFTIRAGPWRVPGIRTCVIATRICCLHAVGSVVP